MDFDFTPLFENWRYLAAGLWMTLTLSFLAMVTSTVVGIAAALGRIYGPVWIRRVITFYIDTTRSIPILVVMVWTFFAFPMAFGVTLTAYWAALVALTFHITAYIAEIVRAGITSIRPGQTWAGLALGMSRSQILRTIVLPQAFVRVLPPYGSQLAITIKNSAIASVIAVPEYLHNTETLSSQTYRPIELYTTALIVFFIIIFPVTRAVDSIYQRIAHLGRS